ncbi:MAG: hypothetical protein AAFR61_02185 [Bacteroidota bacterium]
MWVRSAFYFGYLALAFIQALFLQPVLGTFEFSLFEGITHLFGQLFMGVGSILLGIWEALFSFATWW